MGQNLDLHSIWPWNSRYVTFSVFWKEDRRNFGWPPRSRGTAASEVSILAPLWFGLNSRTCFSIWDLQWFDTYFYSTSLSDYKIHKKLHVCGTVDQDGMKRLGTENLSFGRSYENFEVSPPKPIWRSFAQKWPKSAYIKACIKRNLNNTMQNLTLVQAFWYTW